MVLKLLCAQVVLTKMAVRGAFTLGAVAGTAGVVGLCALRRAAREGRISRRAAAKA
ncbi:hypothetical protein [Roseococcus suduntuyensis]|uniref:Uncharacterized protein n=1 Tax=Roseococcus suduntuyensis TaxID=455361 RepID=A0A840ACU7_9PROT|nr:hypothetical protein [Roseococcus suduntuyensis]MBB3897945.1 hypothetical protein [Roseococcus suduntuyensis]